MGTSYQEITPIVLNKQKNYQKRDYFLFNLDMIDIYLLVCS